MVKAKFGALALTVLMGLGAVSPLHGVTEAHALNAPVANSAQQKTVVSTTDDSDGVMSYKDKESGKTFVSEDNGASWMSEEDYNNSHPAINYEWWTYDEYKEWLEQEKKTLQEMADEHAMAETSEGSFEWTQEMTDQYIAEYEQTLEDIKNGLLVSNHLLSSPHRTPVGADVRKNPERNLSYRKYLLRSYVLSRFPSDCWVLRPATTESPVPDKHPVPFENHPFASYFFSCFL